MDSQTTPPPAAPRPRRRRWFAAAMSIVLAVMAIAGVLLFRATQAVDPFYAAAVATKPAESRKAGERMENRVFNGATAHKS